MFLTSNTAVCAEDQSAEDQSAAEKESQIMRVETSTNEDPDAVRRTESRAEKEREEERWQFEAYGSIRLHANSTRVGPQVEVAR